MSAQTVCTLRSVQKILFMVQTLQKLIVEQRTLYTVNKRHIDDVRVLACDLVLASANILLATAAHFKQALTLRCVIKCRLYVCSQFTVERVVGRSGDLGRHC